MTSSRNTSGGGSAASDLEVTTLQDLMRHNDPDIVTCARLAADALPASYQQEQPMKVLLSSLMEARSNLPDHDPNLTELDKAIIPLTQLERKMYVGGPYAVSHESAPAPPSPASTTKAAAGHMLQDLTHSNLVHEASDLLSVKYLSDAPGPVQWPVFGILYGPCHRPLVCLPTSIGSRPFKNIVYLVDTGAPITELSPAAFQALGAVEALPSAAFANMNGVRHEVRLCEPQGNHSDIPVLGADGMTKLGLELRINFLTREVALHAA